MTGMLFIPGSPCCGKSTLARHLASEYGLTDVCCDDYQDEFLHRGQKESIFDIARLADRFYSSLDDMWLRSPQELFQDELAYYEITFPWLMDKLTNHSRPLIAEGAALLPHRLAALRIPSSQVLCMTPTGTFQRQQYSLREWVAPYLQSCSNPQAAFNNWMDRDALMAHFVRQRAEEVCYIHWLIDGTQSCEDIFHSASQHFNFNR